MVYAGEERLIGEVISLTKEFTTIQVYEETPGMKPGEIITGTGATLSVTLAPASLNNILTVSNGLFPRWRRYQVILSAGASPWIPLDGIRNGILPWW